MLKRSLAEILPGASHSRATQNTSPRLQCWSLQCGVVLWVSLATRSPLPSCPPLPSPPRLFPSCPPVPLSLLYHSSLPSAQIRAGCQGHMEATRGVRGFQPSLTMIAASAATRDAAGPLHPWRRRYRDTLVIEHLLKTNFNNK